MKALLSAFALAALFAPAAAVAQQACDHGEKMKMSCAEGTAWDDKNKTCAPVAGS